VIARSPWQIRPIKGFEMNILLKKQHPLFYRGMTNLRKRFHGDGG